METIQTPTSPFGSYREYKKELDTELGRTAEGFVRIGYLLKVAKDTNILFESAYDNVYDFARAEYGIDKSQVSRFIRINNKFSEGGYSDHLQEKYQEFGYAKLALMIQLPDEINEELTPDFTKTEIRSIKEEIDEENTKTDIEVMLEGQSHEQHAMDTIHAVIHQLLHDEPERYREIHRIMKNTADKDARLAAVREQLAPAGECIYTVRIRGIGRIMLSVKVHEDTVSMVNVRSNEKETESWDTVLTAMEELADTGQSPEESWSSLYGEEFPKKEEVAPVQPKKPARVEKPKKPKQPEKPINTKCEPELAKQLPGQMNVSDFPQYMPEPQEEKTTPEMPENVDFTPCDTDLEVITEKTEEITQKQSPNYPVENPQTIDSTPCDGILEEHAQMPPELIRKRQNEYLEEYAEVMRLATADGITGRYDSALQYLEKAKIYLNALKQLPEVEEEDEE